MKYVATAAALLALPLQTKVLAQGNRSLTDPESRILESRTNVPDLDSNTIGAIQEKLLLAESTIRALTATVAEMGNSAEASRRELADANLRLEQIGVGPQGGSQEVLQTRLLQAARELRLLKEANDSARRQLMTLSEAVQILLKTSSNTNPQARLVVEEEMRKSSELLGASPTAQAKAFDASLQDAMVIDTKDDLSLVVINIGKAHGVKLGMPFEVYRDGKVINTIHIVDVREKISGGVIQSLTPDHPSVKKGDSLQVIAKK